MVVRAVVLVLHPQREREWLTCNTKKKEKTGFFSSLRKCGKRPRAIKLAEIRFSPFFPYLQQFFSSSSSPLPIPPSPPLPSFSSFHFLGSVMRKKRGDIACKGWRRNLPFLVPSPLVISSSSHSSTSSSPPAKKLVSLFCCWSWVMTRKKSTSSPWRRRRRRRKRRREGDHSEGGVGG